MATKRVSVKVCDSCGQEKDSIFRVRISIEGSKGVYGDLCAKCREPLDRIARKVDSRRTPRVGVTTLPVVDMDDVEKAKQSSKSPRRGPRGRPQDGAEQ